MKKIIAFSILILTLTSCGGNKTPEISLDEVTIPNDTLAYYKKDMSLVTGIVVGAIINKEDDNNEKKKSPFNKTQKRKVYFKGAYKEGKPVGTHKRWDKKNSQLIESKIYSEGKLDGLSRSWHPNGQLKFQGTYKNGKEEGVHKNFKKNGKPSDNISYKNKTSMEPEDYNIFAEKIKEKYPAYKDMDNYELAKKIIDKYPVYESQVTFGGLEKKREIY